MNVPRFLALAGDPQQLRSLLASFVPPRRPAHRLNRRFDAPGLVIFTAPETPLLLLPDAAGALVGRVFDRSGAKIECLGPSRGGVPVSLGGALPSNIWGSYVAFLRGDRGTAVLRDPAGGVPVYYRAIGGVEAYFSHFELAQDLGPEAVEIDAAFLRHWLSYPYLRTARTGLADVRELLPGTLRRPDCARGTLASVWSPWDWASPERQLVLFEEAAARLRETILTTVRAQLAGSEDLVLKMSGGLDSSIVAASLAHARIRFRAANFVTRDPDGDERNYARILASALGVPLADLPEDGGRVDLIAPSRPGLRPPLSPALQPLNRALSAHAGRLGSCRFVTGAGGDNLFCYLTTTAPLLDAVKALGIELSVERKLTSPCAPGLACCCSVPVAEWPPLNCAVQPDAIRIRSVAERLRD